MSPSPRLLLLEDELPLARIVRESLERQGYQVHHAANGVLGLAAFQRDAFDLCIVDVMLPQLDGFAFVAEVRRTNQQVPILFLTAKSQPADVVQGFGVGGNDYLRKPFSLEELAVRLRELLRRVPAAPELPDTLALGRYSFVPLKQELWLEGELVVKLSHRESELLRLLASHRPHPLARQATLLQLWGDDSFFHARSMDVFISRLRKHLRHDTSLAILNIRGVGYRLVS
ncbi:response regulator transcription factor [Hymenobacter setariae]|uniref:Response regulator transcription factor n=1 Tax=Hymenobacter setariae TaxID=2594794 RepID=A0A558BMF9_9BACT|nr:response regulator transcription factor [Hymenobacter setariae]TVT37673.1 response regulator transcription factor [Hymenobacter setariae]